MAELKPCPFCGKGNVRLLTATDSYRLPILRGHRAVVCECGVMVFASTNDIAIAKWNRRSNEDERTPFALCAAEK